MYKILSTDNKEYGPAPAEQVRQWILERRLNAQSLIQAEGSAGWKPLSLFPEFSSTLASAGPAPGVSAAPPVVRSDGGVNGLAVGSLICGGIAMLGSGMVCCCLPLTFIFSFISAPLGLAGLVIGIVALSQLKKRPGQEGKGMAIAGIILSAVALVVSVILPIVGFAGVALTEVLK